MKKTRLTFRRHVQHGQALAEYALILVMVAILFGVTLAATGPAIGNVFSNVVYNIIGGKPEDVAKLNAPDGAGIPESFWATVEWLQAHPPEERSFEPNDPLPPPATATAGPSPTPTPITPSPLPSNTPTRTPSPTPGDTNPNCTRTAPWLDTMDRPECWRVSSDTWLGSDQFFGQYYANYTLSGDPERELWHEEAGFPDWGTVDFNWPSGSGPIEGGFTTDNYSVRWTRQIGFGFPKTPSDPGDNNPKNVQFSITTGGGQSGARVWLYAVGSTTPANGCSSVISGGNPTSSSATYGDGQSPSGSPTDCLVIDAWRDNEETLTVTRTLQPKQLYVVEVDFYKRGGDGVVKLGLNSTTTGNPDDASLVSGTAPQCSWNQTNTTRSNSKVFIWEQSKTGEFPPNQVCYLELRGWVDFTLLTQPKLIFWDVWDMSSANTEVWLEIAEYKSDRASMTWTKIPLRQGTTNYAWTRNIINLASYVSGYSQKRLALRFAMKDNNGGARRRWWVDDLEIRNFNAKTFTICTGSKDTCGSYWNMDDPTSTLGDYTQNIDPQFVTSGRWTLTTDNAQGKYSLGINPPLRSISDGGNRIHVAEFNGQIDVTGSVPDFDGDDGVAVLTFHQAYQVKNGTQLELQWTRDVADTAPDNWQTLETLVADPGSSGTLSQDLQETTILLDGVPNWNTQPFRLRFAMIVKPAAVESGGWWLDNVLIHRFDKPRYSDYPFEDTAQGGTDNWLTQGTWGITDQANHTPGLYADSGRAFADSPGGNYVSGTNSSLILRHPVDLNFDTPENIDPTDDSNVQTAAASHPMLTFWQWRELRSNHAFYVEWSNDRGQTWKAIWRYIPSGVPIANSHIQRAWEFVTIDLSDIQASVAINATDKYDDDIILRFRLDASAGGSADDGVYIDDIRVQNYSEVTHKLWDPDEVSGTYGAGDNRRYVEDFDSPVEYWDRWHLGGIEGIDTDQHSGLISLHDSPVNSSGNPVVTTKRTYNVASMDRIMDLRAVSASDYPVLYFWTHYNIGDDDEIQVQIAPEDTSYTPTNGLGVQRSSEYDYERVKGWGAWSTRWEQPANSRVDTWYRGAINLSSYAGKRIKLRFVYNALNSSTKQDGWYIDDVIFDRRITTPIALPFLDSAKSLGNWVTEGSWGLAPDQWRGSGGGPADIGNDFWTGVYYDCERHRSGDRCYNETDFNNLLYTTYTSTTKVERPYDPSLDIQEFALEIDHDFGSNKRPIGGQLDPTWDDYYAGRWKRPITIQNASDVTFITASDDGVRLRYTGPGAPTNKYWNIIEDWNYHGRKVDIATVSFAAGTFDLTLEWFEGGGGAVIILSAGVNNFSFADSPKAGNGPSFPVIDSTEYGNSSLILKNPVDLTGTSLPAIQYYTRYKMAGGTGRFQVSTNGGFDWATPISAWSGYGFSCSPTADCNPTMTGTYWPSSPTDWRQKQHNLGAYKTTTNGGPVINIRFNLITDDWVDDGWYITDISINP